VALVERDFLFTITPFLKQRVYIKGGEVNSSRSEISRRFFWKVCYCL